MILAALLLAAGGCFVWPILRRWAFEQARLDSSTDALASEAPASGDEPGPAPQVWIPASLLLAGVVCLIFSAQVERRATTFYHDVTSWYAMRHQFNALMASGREAGERQAYRDAEKHFTEASTVYEPGSSQTQLAESALSSAKQQRQAAVDALFNQSIEHRGQRDFTRAAGDLGRAEPLIDAGSEQANRLGSLRAEIEKDRTRFEQYKALIAEGGAWLRTENYLEAIRKYEAACKLIPGDPEAVKLAAATTTERDEIASNVLREGELHFKAERSRDAERILARIVEKLGGEHLAEAERLRGLARGRLAKQASDEADAATAFGNYTDSIRWLEEAIRWTPADPKLPPRLAQVRFLRESQIGEEALGRRDYQTANRAAQRAASLQPDDAKAKAFRDDMAAAVRFAEVDRLPWPGPPVARMAFRNGGKTLAVVGRDGLAQVFDVEKPDSDHSPRRTWRVAKAAKGAVDPVVALSRDGRFVARTDAPGMILLRDLDGPDDAVYRLRVDGPTTSLAIFHEEPSRTIRVAVGGPGGEVRAWVRQPDAFAPIKLEATRSKRAVTCLEFSGRKGNLAAGFDGSQVMLFRFLDATYDEPRLCKLEGHFADDRATALLFSPDELTLIAGWGSGLISGWVVNTRELVTFKKVHGNQINDLAFSDDGRLFASVAKDGRFMHGHKTLANGEPAPRVIQQAGVGPRAAREDWEFRGTTHDSPNGAPFQALCYDGVRRLAAAGGGTIRIWSLGDGQFAEDLSE